MEKFFFSMGLGKFCQVLRTYSAGAKCTCRPHLRTYISGTICTDYVHIALVLYAGKSTPHVRIARSFKNCILIRNEKKFKYLSAMIKQNISYRLFASFWIDFESMYDGLPRTWKCINII
jgi:hypothetical protein